MAVDDGVFELMDDDDDGVVCVTMLDDGVAVEVGCVPLDLVDVSLSDVVVAVVDRDGVVSGDSIDVVAESGSSKFT